VVKDLGEVVLYIRIPFGSSGFVSMQGVGRMRGSRWIKIIRKTVFRDPREVGTEIHSTPSPSVTAPARERGGCGNDIVLRSRLEAAFLG